MRRALREFLIALELERAVVEDVLLAAGEASANAIEHAYRDGNGEFRLRAFLTRTHIVVEVSDRGSWRMEGESNRGRGLGIMHALVDRVAIATTREGTTVRLELAL
jgi:anti-sigma regulatory factor (Ser/Thr protein kinase)